MKTFTLIVSLASGCAISSCLLAAPRPLFNGEDLSGWTTKGGSAEYLVENGNLVGISKAQTPNSFLCTEEEFADFVFEFEFKVEAGLNSGIQFRSAENDKKRVYGYQYEFDTDPRSWTAGIYGEGGWGWLYPLEFNPPAKQSFKIGEWNTGKIECVGDSIRTWINGQPASHLIDNQRSSGFIGLQVHSIPGSKAEQLEGKKIYWRNLTIDTSITTPSEADPAVYVRNLLPNQLSTAEQQQGWQSLFDGHSVTHWRSAHGKDFPSKGWHVKDGNLVVEKFAGGGGDIVTRDPYSAFEFDFEFFLSERGNSGVKYFVTEKYLKPKLRPAAIGLEYQILDDKNHPDAKKGRDGNRKMAGLYDILPAKTTVIGRRVPHYINGWNHGRIVAHPDNRVEHWLNGYKVLEYQRGSEAFLELVKNSKFSKRPGFGTAEKGLILLQDHGDEVKFRSLKVRPLNP